MIEERYRHLKNLLPFADSEQLKLYDEVMDQMGCQNQQIKIKNDMLKENAREKRKRKQAAFGEVNGSSYMMDEFSNSQKKR